MKRIIHILAFLVLAGISGSIQGQNLLQNPGFESTDGWDHLWVLSTSDPSSTSALAKPVTSDVHGGDRSVEVSNSVKLKWTYLYSDTVNAPLALRAGKKYEVKGWIKILQKGKETDFSIFWNGSRESVCFYNENPDPEIQPDWFMVRDTIYPATNCTDGFVRLGFRTDKEGLFPAGNILMDDFSVERISEDSDTDILNVKVKEQASPAKIDYMAGTIRLALESGTKVSTVVLELIEVSPGAKVTPAQGDVIDLSQPAALTVTAMDGVSTQDWIVEVEVLPSSEAEILEFSLPGQTGQTGIDPSLYSVDVRVPFGTDITALVPDISTSPGATIDPAQGTAVDFTAPVSFTVTAEDGITRQSWTVTVSFAANTAADIVGFTLAGQEASVVIDQDLKEVNVQVSHGTDITALVPSIELSAGAVVSPASGSITDFSSPVVYTVQAQDGITVQKWTVTVINLPASFAEVTGFSLQEQTGSASIDNEARTITIEVDPGTDLTSMVPEIEVSPGATVTPASGEVIDFSTDVTLTVTAEDGITKQSWVVSVTVASAATEIQGNREEDILIYPNPATSYMVVEMTGMDEILMQDLNGRIVFSDSDPQSRTTIPVEEFERGMYLLTIRSGTHRKVHKVVLE